MQKEELRGLLNQPYQQENWKKVVDFVFPNVSYLQYPLDIHNTNEKVESFKQLGTVRMNDGKNLAMFEVHVAPNVNIANNRVELRNLVAPLIDQERNHGVLVIYEQGKEDYRFTFTAKSTEYDENISDFFNHETDAKRYTYVLGENESCKTAADRFYELARKKDTADINAIEDAFSVEKLSKQFFKEYKEHYERFTNYLLANNSYRFGVFKADDKAIRDFVKLLLGRLVFLQFVQKKRWMGVPSNSDSWHNGDVSFLYNSFKKFENKNLFYSHFLEPLFFDALSKPDRPNDIFNITKTKVPFLNGGLFEKEEIDSLLISFPESYFKELLEFFDQYNFTINEHDLVEHEVGIDPEMLGHIFENLLEDNKDKGSYYTPKTIVQYMCQESLIQYLRTYLKDQEVWPDSDILALQMDKKIQNFVRNKVAGELLNDYEELLAKALKEVKICDPAIGSGAFPMGLLIEIFQCVQVLFGPGNESTKLVWELDDWAPDVVKKSIIQNSIYGVDIEKGAVDIARLRFWLSLIIDEPEPHALPNLDYKIVVGDSLISKLGNDIIEIDWDIKNDEGFQTNIFGTSELHTSKNKILQKIIQDQKEYFNPESDKKKLSSDIRESKIELLITQLDLMIKTKGVEAKPNSYEKAFAKISEIYLQTVSWKRAISELQKLKSKPEIPLNYFDWKLDMPEVMNDQVSHINGFDIVIGNPPYISAVTMARDEETKKIFKENYPLATGSYDLYLLFLLKAITLNNHHGTYTWIIPNKFLVADYAKKTKKKLIESYGLMYSINVSKFNVFEGIGVYPIIIFGSKHSKIQFTELLLESYRDLEQRKFLFPKSLKKHKTLKEYNIKINAGATGFQASQLKDLISNFKEIGSIPFAVSGNIDRYSWTNKSVRYMGERYQNAYINNSSLIVSDSKWSFWLKPKIVIAGMTKTIEAVYVSKPLGLGVGIYGIYDFNGYDPYCLTAILNSNYLTHYFQIKFKDKHLAGGYLAINKSTIEEFPLVKISRANQAKLADLSSEAHKLASVNKSFSHLEMEIDKLVYRLYDLKYDQVKEIESGFLLNEEEYININIKD